MPSQTRRGDNFGLGKFPNGSNGSKWALSNAPNRSFPEGDLPPSPPPPRANNANLQLSPPTPCRESLPLT